MTTFTQTEGTSEYLVFCFQRKLQVVCAFAENKGNPPSHTGFFIGSQTQRFEMFLCFPTEWVVMKRQKQAIAMDFFSFSSQKMKVFPHTALSVMLLNIVI